MPTKSHTPPPHTHSNQPGRSTQPSQRERARTPSALSVALAPPAKILVTTRGTLLLLLDAAAMSVAFIALNASALTRVLMVAGTPGWLVGLSGVLWIVAFGLYLLYYARMLVTPRVDGMSG